MNDIMWKKDSQNSRQIHKEIGLEREGTRGKGNKKEENGKMERTEIHLLWASGILFFLSLVLELLARFMPGFGEWYAATVYPFLVAGIGRASGIFPFSLVELFAYLFIAAAVWYVASHLKQKKKILVRAIFLLTGMCFLFTINCGINYYRRPFSSYLNLHVGSSTEKELIDLCSSLTEAVNHYCEEGIGAQMQISEANREGVAAMERLGKQYPQLSGYYPRPKPLAWSYFFSIQQLCGQYSPFTIEANYNRDMPAYNIPYTICHELSHLRGFMREDEANFIAYLACIGSDCPSYCYSGYLSGWVYAANALRSKDLQAYLKQWNALDGRVREELKKSDKFWSRYDGKVAEASNQMNDMYQKINSQSDGVDSYGRVVDLMLAYAKTAAPVKD